MNLTFTCLSSTPIYTGLSLGTLICEFINQFSFSLRWELRQIKHFAFVETWHAIPTVISYLLTVLYHKKAYKKELTFKKWFVKTIKLSKLHIVWYKI